MPNEKDDDLWESDEGEEVPAEYEAYLKNLPPKTASVEDEADGVFMMTASEAAKAMKQLPKTPPLGGTVQLPTAPPKKSAEKYLIKKSAESTPLSGDLSGSYPNPTVAEISGPAVLGLPLGLSAPSQSQEIQSLITIREYINVMINNYNREKKDLADLRSMLILIDNKIVSMLLSDQFKEYVDFKNARAAMVKAAEVNNIKSGMKKP